MSWFRDKVYQLVQQIPEGKVTTYGSLARAMGIKNARIIGQALHHNPDGMRTPCHRVVFADGRVARGYAFGGPTVQAQVLRQEGVPFLANGTVNLALAFWEPQHARV
jgi:methylated-DNA-protein-cysteine methyltransferase-like protein